MPISKDLLPKSKNKIIKEFLQRGFKDAQKIISEKEASKEFGPFGEHPEIIAYAIAQTGDEELSSFEKGSLVDNLLQKVFRDAVESIAFEKYIECLTLCLYGVILGKYSHEDFRYLYRYSLRKLRNHKKVEEWLWKAITILSVIEYEDPREILSKARSWITFLGSSLPSPKVFQEHCSQFNIDIAKVLDEEDYHLVEYLGKYSEYLDEALRGKPFQEIYSASKDWLPDELSSRVTDIIRKSTYKAAQEKVSSDDDVKTAHKKVKRFFEDTKFRVSDEAVLPIRLQELSTPPVADIVDPVVFEMIPQKLRRDLLSSVAYATKTDKIEIIFLGGPRIGRSGIIIKTKTGGILLDYGLSVANQRIPEWVPELDMIDSVLVSHSHLDHVGGLPILYENYTGKWCSTEMCGAISMILLEDALKVGTPLPPRRNDPLDMVSRYKQRNIEKVAKNHVRLEISKSNEVGPGIVVTPIDACHIPGSTAFLIDIEGTRILYTGDFNLDQSVLFQGANLPTDSDMVIFDGTYWGREDFDRAQVAQTVSNIVSEKGPVIIPSFAVGRSQEMLMILETLGLTKTRNVMVAGMAEKVTKLSGVSGHWSGMKKNKIDLDKDDILVAGGGMMGGGLARHHFNEHRDNPDAAIVLCGYLAPRTPAWNLLNGYEPHKCSVEYARLSAHSSASNLENYIESCKGKKVIVHTPTEKTPKGLTMPDLKSRLTLSV